jgi:hypothetical protein
MWSTYGFLNYNPKREGLRKRPNNWVILDLHRDVTRYFRWFIEKNVTQFGLTKINLCQPSWDAHVSIIRGDNDLRGANSFLIKKNWGKGQGKKIAIDILPETLKMKKDRDNPGFFFIVDIVSDELSAIRSSFGLNGQYNLHLTVGRTWEESR